MRTLVLLVAMTAGIAACRSDSTGLEGAQTGPTKRTYAPSVAALLSGMGQPIMIRRHTSAKEDSLIQDILSRYTGRRREFFRQGLYDQRASLPRIARATPAVQQLLAQIAAIRQARSDSASAFQEAHAPYPASVMLVAHLNTHDSTATALILRRTDEQPHDVILLPEGTVTVGTFAAAIEALIATRQRTSDDPTRNELLVVHGSKVPSHWTQTGFAKIAQWELHKLKTAETQRITGVGPGRAIEIQVAQTHQRVSHLPDTIRDSLRLHSL